MALSEFERISFIVFFATHIPITAFIDAQAFLPRSVFPSIAIDLVEWHCSAAGFKDSLMREKPSWFRHIVLFEIMLQFPFFFVALAALLKRSNSVRLPALVYGSHVATTMIPILGHFSVVDPSLSPSERATLIAIYCPYLILPVWLVVAMMRGDPFEKLKQ